MKNNTDNEPRHWRFIAYDDDGRVVNQKTTADKITRDAAETQAHNWMETQNGAESVAVQPA